MKNTPSHFIALGWVILIATTAIAQDEKKSAQPVEFPKLEHYTPLWTRSIFTTKELPAPEEPGGPNFADNLSLSGIYEIDGGVVAVLVERTTSQVMEARIGSENEMGIKIRQVTPGDTVDKTRIQLQKGDKAGWVTFADASAAQPAEVIQRAVIPTQSQGQVQGTAASAPSQSLPQSRVPGVVNPAPQRAGAQPPVNPILPPPSVPVPAARPGDVPLPPL